MGEIGTRPGHVVRRHERCHPAGQSVQSALVSDWTSAPRGLTDSGATVVTTTRFPIWLGSCPVVECSRSVIIDQRRDRSPAARYAFRLVDCTRRVVWGIPKCGAQDRVHGSPTGHELSPPAVADGVHRPGSSHDWAHARPDVEIAGLSVEGWTRRCCGPRTDGAVVLAAAARTVKRQGIGARSVAALEPVRRPATRVADVRRPYTPRRSGYRLSMTLALCAPGCR